MTAPANGSPPTADAAVPAEALARAGRGFTDLIAVAGDLRWVELRPDEGGRSVAVSEHGDLSPPDLFVGSRVYEYGGGAIAGDAGRTWFVEFRDQRIYESEHGSTKAITPEGKFRYGDLTVD